MFIAVSTFNRPILSRLCLEQQFVATAGEGVEWHVWDDGSYEVPDLNGLDLASWRRSSENIGPHRIRGEQIEQFLGSDHKVLYLTDSDALLDPAALSVGRRLLESVRGRFPIVSLYNSPFHGSYTVGSGAVVEGELVVARAFAPGISMMIHRESLKPVAHKIKDLLTDEWDYRLPRLLGKPCLVTIRSYVEHLGAGGIHSKPDDWDRDRAINPTAYLEESRKRILSALHES